MQKASVCKTLLGLSLTLGANKALVFAHQTNVHVAQQGHCCQPEEVLISRTMASCKSSFSESAKKKVPSHWLQGQRLPHTLLGWAETGGGVWLVDRPVCMKCWGLLARAAAVGSNVANCKQAFSAPPKQVEDGEKRKRGKKGSVPSKLEWPVICKFKWSLEMTAARVWRRWCCLSRHLKDRHSHPARNLCWNFASN